MTLYQPFDIVYRNRVQIDEVPLDGGDQWAWQMVKATPPGRLGYRPPSDGIKAMKEWCAENTKHQWSSYTTEFFFESEQDATWFSLRWS